MQSHLQGTFFQIGSQSQVPWLGLGHVGILPRFSPLPVGMTRLLGDKEGTVAAQGCKPISVGHHGPCVSLCPAAFFSVTSEGPALPHPRQFLGVITTTEIKAVTRGSSCSGQALG